MKFCYDCSNIIESDFEKCPFCGGDLSNDKPKEIYHLAPGSTLKNGRYLIGRAIGYGGFGVTYAGFDLTLQRRVAVKEYFPSGFANRVPKTKQISVYTGDRKAQYGAGLSRFLLEARNMAKFGKEPNIVSVLDFFEENNTAYIVMEYLDGMDLKHYLRQVGGILPYQQAIEIIKPICRALTKVHKEGVVHRDISPDNIFITDDNIIKLIDFGAARLALGDREKTLSVILKPGFAPPEQYRKKSIQGAFTDIYALGATFYRMITGKAPDDSVDRVMEDELEPPSAVIGGIPKAIDDAVMKAMALDYRTRFQSAADFLRALDEGKNGIAVPAVPVIPAVPIRQAVQPDAEPQASDNSADETNAEYYEPRLISETDKTVAMGYGRNNVIENEYAGSVEPSKPSKPSEPSEPPAPSEAKKAAAPASEIGENQKNEQKPMKSRGFPLWAKLTAAGLAICMLFAILMISGVIKVKPTLIPIDETHFPDANFRNFVLTGSDNETGVKIDTDGSGSLSSAEIAAVTNINVSKNIINIPETEKIASLTGIEYFTALTQLNCSLNQLTELDVSKNTALTQLNCAANRLTSLNVSKNTALTELDCGANKLTSLDVSKNTALTEFYCYTNQLTSLNVSKNTALTGLICGDNKLTALDVSKNTALTVFNCCANQLTALDVSKNTALYQLECYANQLTSLDVSKNTALTYLSCSSNQLTSLDVSKNTALTGFKCWGNQLTSLDVSKNTALTTVLDCYDNQLTQLDISKNTALTRLQCSDNNLTNLDIRSNTQLTTFVCDNTQLTNLDVSNNTLLTWLSFENTMLSTIDLSHNTALEHLFCNGNALTTLDLSHNTALTELCCHHNQISNLSSFSGLTKLEKLDLSYNNLTASTDVSPLYNLTLLQTLKIKEGNSLTQSQIEAMQSHLPNCEIN